MPNKVPDLCLPASQIYTFLVPTGGASEFHNSKVKLDITDTISREGQNFLVSFRYFWISGFQAVYKHCINALHACDAKHYINAGKIFSEIDAACISHFPFLIVHSTLKSTVTAASQTNISLDGFIWVVVRRN